MKEVITLSESFQVAHRNSHAVGGRSQVGKKTSVRPVNTGSFHLQRGRSGFQAENAGSIRQFYKCDRLGHIA